MRTENGHYDWHSWGGRSGYELSGEGLDSSQSRSVGYPTLGWSPDNGERIKKKGHVSVERTGTEVPGTLSSIGHTTCRITNKKNKHQRQRNNQKGSHRTQRTTQTWPEEADRGLNLSAKLSLEAEPSKFLLALGLPVSGSHKWPVNIRIRSGELYVKVFKT